MRDKIKIYEGKCRFVNFPIILPATNKMAPGFVNMFKENSIAKTL